ncbi:MAG: hypothetical protein ABSE17_04465 [Candidatus Levyibacteriota bacterium]|jgi:hypothetical protein
MIILERESFGSAARRAVAEEVTSEELTAFISSGDPDCVPGIEVFVAAPHVRTIREKDFWWGRKKPASKSKFRINIRIPLLISAGVRLPSRQRV